MAMPDLDGVPHRFVVFHRPGRAWDHSRDALAQDGLTKHVAYLRQLGAQGRIHWSGPLLGGPGRGMMLLAADCGEAEATEIAAGDPAVVSGLVEFELLRWLIVIDGAAAGKGR